MTSDQEHMAMQEAGSERVGGLEPDTAQERAEADVCEHCNSYWDDHDHEHLARTCYPLRVDKLKSEKDAAYQRGLRDGLEQAIAIVMEQVKEHDAEQVQWNMACNHICNELTCLAEGK